MEWKIGETVGVYAFGHWYVGQVVKLGRKRPRVRYTSGTGATREKACKACDVARLDETLPTGRKVGEVARDFRPPEPVGLK